MGPYAGKETGETALFRQLLGRLKPSDVVLADRYFCSYFMIAMLLALGVDVVFRLHHLRRRTFQRGSDHAITWLRPRCPDWMDQETYEAAFPSRSRCVRFTCKSSRPAFASGRSSSPPP